MGHMLTDYVIYWPLSKRISDFSIWRIAWSRAAERLRGAQHFPVCARNTLSTEDDLERDLSFLFRTGGQSPTKWG